MNAFAPASERLLQSRPNIEMVGEAADTHGLAVLLDAHACDVVVSDIDMPGLTAAATRCRFCAVCCGGEPHPYVVVLTMICHGHMLSGLRNIGVSGIVDKRDTAKP